MTRSQQGFNVAFIGTNIKAQTSCAQYLKLKHKFKRLDMDQPVQNMVRSTYNFRGWTNIPKAIRLDYYDALYNVDPELFVRNVRWRMQTSSIDTVIYDVRYINEMQALQEMGFIICHVLPSTSAMHLKKFVGNSKGSTVALAEAYDRRFAANYSVDYSVNWTNFASTKPLMDEFLTQIGYKLDIPE